MYLLFMSMHSPAFSKWWSVITESEIKESANKH